MDGGETTQIPPLNVKDRSHFTFGPSPPSTQRVSTYLCESTPSYCTPNPGTYEEFFNVILFELCDFIWSSPLRFKLADSLVGSLQYRSLTNSMYWFPLPFQLPVMI